MRGRWREFFEVIHKENLGFEEMPDEVIKFKVELIKRGQVGLFYFSGHGLEVQKENYLLPTDLRLPETELVKEKSIRAQWVVNVMQHAGSQVKIFLRVCFCEKRSMVGRVSLSSAA